MQAVTRIVVRTLIFLLVFLLVVVGVLYVMFRNELATLTSIQNVEGTYLFTMEYRGDYGLDEFLQVGAASDEEMKNFIVRRLLKGIPMDFELPELGCSTFVGQLSDGTPVFGRNFDEQDCAAMVLITRPEDGYDSISMVNLDYIGFSREKLPVSLPDSLFALAAPYAPLDGVNEKGLAAGMLMIAADPTNQDTGKIDITTTSAVRMLLDRAATVEEAVELLAQYDMHSSAGSCFHFHIADAYGGSVIVEYVDDEMIVVEETAATNFLFTQGTGVREIGRDRYEVLQRRLEENGGVFANAKDAMHLLQAVCQMGTGTQRANTQWSGVYDQRNAALTLSVNKDYETLYTFLLEK